MSRSNHPIKRAVSEFSLKKVRTTEARSTCASQASAGYGKKRQIKHRANARATCLSSSPLVAVTPAPVSTPVFAEKVNDAGKDWRSGLALSSQRKALRV